MPPQKQTASGLFAKIGKDKLKKAFNAHKADETTFGNMGDPPPGIENGIAKLVDARFDRYKAGTKLAGEYYFYLAGVIVEPKTFTDKLGNTTKTEGLRVSFIEPVCDTPEAKTKTTIDDHIAVVTNEMRKLGVETAELEAEDLETAVAALKESAPFFKFRTWMGEATKEYPNPRVNTNWLGKCDEPEGASESGVDDETGAVAENSGGGDDAPSEPVSEAGETGGDDIAALVETAVNGAAPDDEAAQNRLKELALEAGVDQDSIDNAADWQAVADLITAGAAPPAEETPWEPVKGDIYRYSPIDPKTKKPFTDPKTKKAKFIDVEVTAVDKKTSTVSLKDVDTGKVVYKSVKWDALEAAGK